MDKVEVTVKMRQIISYIFIGTFFINFNLVGETAKEELLAKVKINGKYGYINTSGEFQIQPQYENAYSFSEGIALVTYDNEKFIYINSKNEIIIDREFLYSFSSFGFREGYAIVNLGSNNYGFINSKGELIKQNFTEIYPFYDGLALALDKKNKKIGYINYSGEWNISFEYPKEALKLGIRFKDNLALLVNYKYKSGYIDKKGKEIISCKYEQAYDFNENLAGVKSGDYYGFIDPSGKMAIKPQFDDYNYFKDGLCSVSKKQKCGFIDKKGKLIIPYKFESLGIFSENLACICKDDLYGYIDKKGKFVIQPQYDQGLPFNCGFAAVVKDGKVGYINRNGEFVINPMFEKGQDFVDINATTPGELL